jgi:hypothetical protein
MQGAATQAMPLRIVEEWQRRRRPRAAATPWGGRPFARGDWKRKEQRTARKVGRREMQKAGRDARIHFSTGC